jgi:hypothetical protein
MAARFGSDQQRPAHRRTAVHPARRVRGSMGPPSLPNPRQEPRLRRRPSRLHDAVQRENDWRTPRSRFLRNQPCRWVQSGKRLSTLRRPASSPARPRLPAGQGDPALERVAGRPLCRRRLRRGAAVVWGGAAAAVRSGRLRGNNLGALRPRESVLSWGRNPDQAARECGRSPGRWPDPGRRRVGALDHRPLKERRRRRRRYATGAGIAPPSEPMPAGQAARADRDSGQLDPRADGQPGWRPPGRGSESTARACTFMAHRVTEERSLAFSRTAPHRGSSPVPPAPSHSQPRANKAARLTLALAPAGHGTTTWLA